MEEAQEIPIDNEVPEEPTEADEQELQRRARKITSEIYVRLGLIILILAAIALIFTILTYVFDEAWPDKTLLLIEQIIGYVLIGIATIVGTGFLIQAKRAPSKAELILEPIKVEEDTTKNELDETHPEENH